MGATVLRRGGRAPRVAHVESNQPALVRHLDDAGVGQPPLHEAHRAPDHRGRLEARAQEPRDLREERQPLAARLGGAQGLTFVLEDLGPLERLGREAGQRGEEAQVGRVRLRLGDEGQGQDSQRPDAPDERLGDDRDGLVQLPQRTGHQLAGDVRAGLPVRADGRHDGPTAGEAGARVAVVHRNQGTGQQRRAPAAGQARQRTFAGGRDTHHGGLRAKGAPRTGDRGMGHVAGGGGGGQRRAQLVQVLAPLQIDELNEREAGPLHRLGRGAGDGEQEALVGVRDLPVEVPVHDDGTDRVVRDDQRHDGQSSEAARAQRHVEVGALPPQLLEGLREERDVVAQDRAVGPQRGQDPVDRLLGAVAEPPERPQVSPLVNEGERGGVDVQLVAQRGEHGVGHLGGVRRGRERPRHGLHALRGLCGHPPPSLVPGLGAGRPQLHVALAPEIGDPHRQGRGGQLGHDAERVVQLAVAVRRRADDEREEGRQQPDDQDARGPGERGGDEGGDGQEADEGDIAPVDGEDDRHGRHPEERQERGDGLGAIGPVATSRRLELLFACLGHRLLSPVAAAVRG